MPKPRCLLQFNKKKPKQTKWLWMPSNNVKLEKALTAKVKAVFNF
jgi:hypothetical protein